MFNRLRPLDKLILSMASLLAVLIVNRHPTQNDVLDWVLYSMFCLCMITTNITLWRHK